MRSKSRSETVKAVKWPLILPVLVCAFALMLQGCDKKVIQSPGGGAPSYRVPGDSSGASVPTGPAGSGKPSVVTIYESPSVAAGDPGTSPYTVQGKTYHPMLSVDTYSEEGIASWYGTDFHGKVTASGERYDMNAKTAAHKVLPFGTLVRVINLENGKTTDVRINDRGPFVEARIIDLSRAAARDIDIINKGTAMVRIETLNKVTGLRDGELAGRFYVQLGSFAKESNADGLVKTLGRAGTKARSLYSVNVNMWRVQAGPYDSLSATAKAADKLRGEFPDCYIVAD
ncbi:MAG: septal ring lytic transglycosylase RlpA family protein [Deltaproteobacteria bacterium]|nr:septal ring lytic transglycosylase RlpA family protein [Deltaproteobacteria bacterium]